MPAVAHWRDAMLSGALRDRAFRPSLQGFALLLVGVTAASSLGAWQLDRAAQKRALIAQFELGAATVVPLTIAAEPLPRYQRVTIHGRYDSRRQILLDNMPSPHGQPGYRVLTPLERADGGWVMVDRGWIAAGATRADLPDVGVGGEARTVRGQLDSLPQPGLRLAEPGAALRADHWPRVLNFPTLDQLQQLLGVTLYPQMIRLDSSQPDGYERSWQLSTQLGPQRHIAYAVQWFALGVAMIVVFVVISLRPRDPHSGA